MGGKDRDGNESHSEGVGGDFLEMPIDYIDEEEEGSTGMCFFKVRRKSRKQVADYIVKQVKNYGSYEAKLWDCEDYAFLAASEVRCTFLGQPVAIALGKAREGPGMDGQDHALLVLWFGDQVGGVRNCVPEYFDPTLGSFVNDFDTRILIPLPLSGLTEGNSDLPFNKKLPLLDEAAFALDGKDYQFGKINEVMNTLRNGGISRCPVLDRSPEDMALLKDPHHRYWSESDENFWQFAHLRQKHKGAPIGFAVGTATNAKSRKPFEQSAVVLWKQQDEFFYWDANTEKKLSDFKVKIEFKPRLVMV